MRIAVSGAHATGKTTLLSELARHLPGHSVIDEPYYALTAEGAQFSAPPSEDDLETLLETSLTSYGTQADVDALFDRTPADYLAYLSLSTGNESVGRFLPEVADALASLALVVFVPIERPDRIDVPADEGVRLRRQVDKVLRDMLIDDEWGFAPTVVEVAGPCDVRVAQVLAAIDLL